MVVSSWKNLFLVGTEHGLEGGGEVESGQISSRIQAYNPAVQRTPDSWLTPVGAGVGMECRRYLLQEVKLGALGNRLDWDYDGTRRA